MIERSGHAKEQAHRRIAAAIAAQQVRMGVNVGIANRPGSPVFVRSESAVPVFLSFFGVIAATFMGGPILGVTALGLAGLVWIWLIHPRLRDRVYERSVAYATGGVAEFERMWQAGAISLQRADTGSELRSPEGDWVDFGDSLAE